MSRLRSVGSVSILVMALGLSVPADAGKTETHTGSIASIADDARTFVLAEVGPWQARDGATVITYRTIALAAETEFAIVARVDAAPSGFRGDFVEFPIGPERVYLNDYVTVVCRRDGKRLVALKITVHRDAGTGGRRDPANSERAFPRSVLLAVSSPRPGGGSGRPATRLCVVCGRAAERARTA